MVTSKKEGAKTGEEAFRELQDHPWFPKAPPAPTVYVVIEFPCIVKNAADGDAAYADAIAQLQARLATANHSLPMKYICEDNYQQLLIDGGYDTVLDMPLSDFSWAFGPDNLPASPAALMVEIAKYEATMHAEMPDHKEFDVSRLAGLSGYSEINIRFTHFFTGDEPTKRIGNGSHDMSWAEIIWLLHKSTMKDNLGDHIFFEGLHPVATDGAVLLFDAIMGS